ncbi:MAG: iron(III) transport system ATP-binding protein [Candidatus Atribacteria bacterium]|nr:iron(III) transport system ATP-binding protein [Candidatus Atribacteria bacterium]
MNIISKELKEENIKTKNIDDGNDKVHVELVGLSKKYGEHYAVKNLNLKIKKGSFTCLLGPSGCGKTTTLRMISGFVNPTEGDVIISGVSQKDIPPHKRSTSMVFQEYALFPHMTVRDNISYGLKLKRISEMELKKRVDYILEFMNLTSMADRFPKFLSGGQQQRVALARSLVMEPEVLLMDEPLSNLDAKLRVKLRSELKEIQQRLGITTIYVTHDQEEALSISDYIAILDEGILQQFDSPWELYFNPKNKFVADFVGLNNFIPVKVEKVEKNYIAVKVADKTLKVENRYLVSNIKENMILSIRPESIKLNPPEETDNLIKGRVKVHNFLGSVVRYWVDIGAGSQDIIVDDHDPYRKSILSGEVNLKFESFGIKLFD